jgi:hypothetical protein
LAKTKHRGGPVFPSPSIPDPRTQMALLNAGFWPDSLGLPLLPPGLDRFVQEAPPAVMVRIALDWILDEPILNQLFAQAVHAQYTREWTLEHLVQVMLDVACGFRPSPRAAFRRRQLELIASLSSFYRKLNRMELTVSIAVVRHTAMRLE